MIADKFFHMRSEQRDAEGVISVLLDILFFKS